MQQREEWRAKSGGGKPEAEEAEEEKLLDLSATADSLGVTILIGMSEVEERPDAAREAAMGGTDADGTVTGGCMDGET